MPLLAQAIPPPPDDPAKFLPWALLIVGGVVVVLWRLREGERSAELVRLRAALELKETQLEDARAKYVEEVKRNARSLSAARLALALKSGRPDVAPPGEWDETTAVSLQQSADDRAAIDRLCREFAEDTPPRPRAPSRSGR